MATITRRLGSFADGQVVFEFDYDDVNLRLTAIRCINNTNQPASGTATSVAQPSRTFTRTFAANTTTVLNIPTGATQRLNITIDARGRVNGVDYRLEWPAVA